MVHISPGVRLGSGPFGLLAEGRYQIMAIGEFDDVFLMMGGLSFLF